ncbi:MAG: beta strand repeat-containing protein [Myxococcales bacterium]
MKRLSLIALVVAAACGSGNHDATAPATTTTKFQLTQMVNAVAGVEVTFRVAAVDTSGAVNRTYRGTVQFATDDTRSTAPGEATFGSTDAGQITAKVIFKTAGPRTFVVVDKANPSVLGLVQVVVAPGAATRLTLEGLPGQVPVDAVQSVTVTVRDAFDNPVTDYGGTVRFASSDAQASSIPDARFLPTDLGVRIVAVQFGTAGTQSLSASDLATPSIAGSASTQVTHGPAARLVLAGIPPETLAGTPLTVTVSAVDNHGNLVTDFTGTVQFASTDPKAALPLDYTFTVADLGSHTFTVVLTSAAISTIIVSSADLPAVLANVDVHGAGAAHVTLEGLPPQVTVDDLQSITVTIRDALGNPVTGYVGTLHFTNSDPQASPIPDTEFVPADLGAKVVTLQFGTAGEQTLSASDTLTSSITGFKKTQVLHGPAAQLLLSGIPLSTVAGTTLTANVTAVDGHGNVATDFTGTVHFASTDPTAALTKDFVFTASDLGSRVFAVAFTKATTSTFTASSTGLAPAVKSIVVGAAPAAQVTLEGLPTQLMVDVTQNVTVTVRDAFRNPVTDYSGTLQFTSSDGQAPPISPTTFVPAHLGVEIIAVQFATAGMQSVSAHDTVTASIAGSTSTQVLHGPPARLTLTDIPPSAIAGTLLPATVTAVDKHGNAVTDFSGTVHFASTDPGAQLPADFPFTAANLGTRRFTVVLTRAATSSVTVTSAGLLPATVSVIVGHASAARVTLEGLPPLAVVDVSQNVTVTVRDAFGNPVTDYAGTLHLTSSDAQASFAADANFVAADLGVKVLAVQFGTAGTQSLSAADGSTPPIAGSTSTQVVHGPAARLLLQGIPSSTVAGTLLVATVTAVDRHGNVVTDFAGTVHFESTDPNATLPADTRFGAADNGIRNFSLALATAGARSISVTQVGGPATGATVNVAVANAPANRITVDAHATQVAVDTNAVFTVTIRDRFGNPALDYIGTIHFVPSDPGATPIADVTFVPAMFATKDVTLQFATAGDQSLLAADTADPTIKGGATVKVIHGPAARLVLGALPDSTVAGTPLTPTVTVVDNHGNPATDFTGTVHVSSTDPNAQLPADFAFKVTDLGSRTFPVALTSAASSTVTVASAGLAPATATVSVRNAPATQLTLEGFPAQVVAGVSQSVTVTARDAFRNPAIDYAGIVRFANTDGQASVVADATFGAADLGVKIVAVQFGTAGTQTLSAKDTVRPSIAGSATTVVLHGQAVSLTLAGIPATTVAGALLPATVAAVDSHGNLVTDFTGTVHFSSTDPNATLPPDTAFVGTNGGVRSFSVALTTAGPRSVSVSQVGGTVTGATANVTVSNAPANRITLDAHAAQVAVDTNAVFTVTIRDRFGNPALNYTGTVHFVSTDFRSTSIKDVTFTPAMFATIDVALQFATAGDQSLLATDAVNPAITGSTVIKVTNGPAAAYALSALPTAAVAGEPLPLTITATDAHGNVVLNYTGSAAVTSTDPSDRLPAAGAFVGGVRSVSLAFVTAGPHHATVTEVAGLIHADTSVVNIVSGNAGALVLTDASATAGTPASTTVVAKDAFGNVVGSYRGTVTLTSTDPQAIVPPPYAFVAADAGQHAFPITLKTAGTWSVTATDAASSISGSATFTVAPAAGASCDLAVIGKAGAQIAMRVRVSDGFANLATGYTGTLTFSSSDAQAQLPPPATYIASDRGSRDFTAVLPTPGDQTLRATDAATSFSCQANVSIVTAQFFAVTFAGPEGWAGTPRSATVQAQDANGTPTAYAGTIAFSSSDPLASFPPTVTVAPTDGGRATVNVTFKTMGLQTFTAKDSADATRTGTAFQLVHGLVYTDPAIGGKVRLIVNAAASNASVVQLDLVSNASLFTLGITDPQNSGRVLPSSVRNGAFATGMNLPLDASKVGADTQLLVLPAPSSAILGVGAAPQLVGAAMTNGILYSGISQKRLDLTLTCTLPCTNDHLRGDVQTRPFPGASSVYYSLRLRLTPGAAAGTVFDGQTLASNTRFRAAVRDRSGSDVFSGTADFAIGKLEVK